jgi:hypothetical protein
VTNPTTSGAADAARARTGQLGRRVVFGLFFALATAFILSSVVQITRQVFFQG